MGLFNTILENVLNEIKSDDAYARFYSNMPREDFNAITGGAAEIDKFVQFLLNSVRDGASTVDDAAKANKEFQEADPLIRQNILNAFKNGEFETADEVLIELDYLKNGGGVINKNKFAKEGYVKLAEDDNWVITCTTNYMANNHYFGDTKWCTASDRMGRYDGYLMFKRYNDYGSSLLIQARSKKPDGETYQFEVDGIDTSGPECEYRIGCVCDSDDVQQDFDDVAEKVGNILTDTLGDSEKIRTALKIQQSQQDAEARYQAKQSKIIDKKRQRKEERLNRLYAELNQEAERRNALIKGEYDKEWSEVERNGLYRDPKLLSKLLKINAESLYDEDNKEELAEQNHHLSVTSYEFLKCAGPYCPIVILYLGTITFKRWYAEAIYDEYDDVDNYQLSIDESMEALPRKCMFVKADTNLKVEKVLSEIPLNSEKYFPGYSPVNGSPEYIAIYNIYDEEDNECMYLYNIYEDKLICFFKGKLDWSSDFMPRYAFKTPDGGTIFVSRARENYSPIGVVVLTKDYEHTFFRNSNRFICDDSRRILLDKESGLVLQMTESGTTSCKVETPDEIEELFYSEIPGFVYIYFEDGTQNILDFNHNDYVFGMKCIDTGPFFDTAADENAGFIGKFKVRGHTSRYKYIWYHFDGGRYEVADDRHGKKVECDKYGKTQADKEKEAIGDRNFKKWLEKGGYTPEQKAQMEKMWADRQEQGTDGSKALNAWNDYDRNLDKYATDNTKYIKDFDWVTKMQQFDDDENWRGYINQKDPEGMKQQIDRAIGDGPDSVGMGEFIAGNIPDYVRRNPWYRVDRMGRAIDQPWYDEDEVPARFSDESLNEGVKKVKDLMNRILKD